MVYDIGTIKSDLLQVQTTLHWDVTFNSPNAVTMEPSAPLRATTVGLPTENYSGDTKVMVGGFEINYVGKLTRNGTINIVFVEGTDAKLSKFTDAYHRAKSSQGQGVQKNTPDLKFDIDLRMRGVDDKVTQTMKLIGCMIQGTWDGQLNQSQDPLGITWTVTFDDFERNF